MNKLIITGNLCSNPEIRYTPSGTAVCEVSIANNRKFKDKEETTFLDCVVFGAQAENLHKYLEKGSKVLVEGRLTQDRWTDKTTQKPRSKLKLTAEIVEFLGGKQREMKDDSNYEDQPPAQPPQNAKHSGGTYMPPTNPNNATYTSEPPVQQAVQPNLNEEDVPF